MKCPVCSTMMVKARATAYGEEYDYCRPCGKELAELTGVGIKEKHSYDYTESQPDVKLWFASGINAAPPGYQPEDLVLNGNRHLITHPIHARPRTLPVLKLAAGDRLDYNETSLVIPYDAVCTISLSLGALMVNGMRISAPASPLRGTVSGRFSSQQPNVSNVPRPVAPPPVASAFKVGDVGMWLGHRGEVVTVKPTLKAGRFRGRPLMKVRFADPRAVKNEFSKRVGRKVPNVPGFYADTGEVIDYPKFPKFIGQSTLPPGTSGGLRTSTNALIQAGYGSSVQGILDEHTQGYEDAAVDFYDFVGREIFLSYDS